MITYCPTCNEPRTVKSRPRTGTNCPSCAGKSKLDKPQSNKRTCIYCFQTQYLKSKPSGQYCSPCMKKITVKFNYPINFDLITMKLQINCSCGRTEPRSETNSLFRCTPCHIAFKHNSREKQREVNIRSKAKTRAKQANDPNYKPKLKKSKPQELNAYPKPTIDGKQKVNIRKPKSKKHILQSVDIDSYDPSNKAFTAKPIAPKQAPQLDQTIESQMIKEWLKTNKVKPATIHSDKFNSGCGSRMDTNPNY